LKTVEVISFGALNCDNVAFITKFPEAEQKINSTQLLPPAAAGVAIDCLTMVHNLGMECGHIGKLGDDIYGEIARKQLEDDQIDLSFTSVSGGERSALAWVMVNSRDGERCHIMHPTGEAGFVNMEDVEKAKGYIASAKAVHIEMLQMPAKPLYEAMRIARENGVTTSMDLDIAPRFLYEYQYADPELMRSMIGGADILKICKDALKDLTDQTDLVEAAADIMREYGSRLVIITDGEKGCVLAWRGDDSDEIRSAAVPAFTDTAVVDTTGAGDAFSGGFLYGYLNGYPYDKAAQLGNACGYLKALNIGARNMPSREKVETFLRSKGWESL
jgi:sugar/nucleoside kinase (ribokinase family)